MKTLGKSRYLNWVSVKLESNLWSEIDLKLIRLISRRNVPWPTIWLGLSLSIRPKIQVLLKCEHLVIVSLLIVFTVSAHQTHFKSKFSIHSYLSLVVTSQQKMVKNPCGVLLLSRRKAPRHSTQLWSAEFADFWDALVFGKLKSYCRESPDVMRKTLS